MSLLVAIFFLPSTPLLLIFCRNCRSFARYVLFSVQKRRSEKAVSVYYSDGKSPPLYARKNNFFCLDFKNANADKLNNSTAYIY